MRTHDSELGESHGPRPDVVRKSVEHPTPEIQAVLRLQRMAGNGAVSSLLQREEESSPLAVVGAGSGRPLEDHTRADMEAQFGQDFSDVRVHTGAAATESAESIGAQAYTTGTDIVFQGDRYAPDTPQGRHTLAHELTHVVQQRTGPVDGTPTTGGISVSDPGDRFEQQAAATADRIAAETRETETI